MTMKNAADKIRISVEFVLTILSPSLFPSQLFFSVFDQRNVDVISVRRSFLAFIFPGLLSQVESLLDRLLADRAVDGKRLEFLDQVAVIGLGRFPRPFKDLGVDRERLFFVLGIVE